MKVLTQAIKKGPLIAAQALTNVSRYIKEIHKVNERLKGLLDREISTLVKARGLENENQLKEELNAEFKNRGLICEGVLLSEVSVS